MKHFYIAITVTENDRYYSYILKVSELDNLCSKLNRINGLKTANIFSTKKKAAEVVERWNANYKLNGTYMFDN